MKAISWVGVPALTLVALSLLLRPVWEAYVGVSPNYIAMAMGFAVLYQCVIGLLGLQYINMEIILLDEGLEIHYKNSTQLIPWSLIVKMKEFTFAGTTRLSDINGNTIIYASDSMKNFRIIKDLLREMHG